MNRPSERSNRQIPGRFEEEGLLMSLVKWTSFANYGRRLAPNWGTVVSSCAVGGTLPEIPLRVIGRVEKS